MNRKAINIMIVILVCVSIAGGIVLYLMLGDDTKTHADGERSIEDMIEDSFETEAVTTDLKDGSYVKIKFRIVTSNEETKQTLQKDFRLQNIIIKELATKEEKDLKTGLAELEASIKKKLNELVVEGEVTDVYTTEKVLQ
jgi:flagellar protein FliL